MTRVLAQAALMVSVLKLCAAQDVDDILDSPTSRPPTVSTARGFLYRTVSSGGRTAAYTVYIPPTYTTDRAWPTLLFLHGSGERGVDGFLQTDVGIAKAIRRNHDAVPAIVVMPQCPNGKSWTDPEPAKLALDCLEDVSKAYKVDPKRMYLTGLSMGGRGVWFIAARTRGAFAAMVPICGGGDPKDASKLADIPIWCFHGAEDKSVPVAETERMVDAVEKAGGDIKFTRFAGADHAVWDRVYGDPKMWQWLFAQELMPAKK